MVSPWIGPTGNVVNLSADALRETSVELWGNETWNEMNTVAECFLDVRAAELLRIEYTPLPADAKRVVDKLIAAGGRAALERPANSMPTTSTPSSSRTTAAGTSPWRMDTSGSP